MGAIAVGACSFVSALHVQPPRIRFSTILKTPEGGYWQEATGTSRRVRGPLTARRQRQRRRVMTTTDDGGDGFDKSSINRKSPHRSFSFRRCRIENAFRSCLSSFAHRSPLRLLRIELCSQPQSTLHRPRLLPGPSSAVKTKGQEKNEEASKRSQEPRPLFPTSPFCSIGSCCIL